MQQDGKEKSGRPEIDPVREQMMKRTDLTPNIDQVLNGTFEPTVPDEELEIDFEVLDKTTFHYIDEHAQEALMVWDNSKIERNTYLAIFSSEVWEFLQKEKTNFDINISGIDPTDPEKIYVRLNIATSRLFSKATDEWQTAREASLQKPEPEWTPRDKAFARLKKIIHFGKVNEISIDTPAQFLDRGVDTAVDTMWGLLKMIDELAKVQNVNLEADEYKEIFERAFGPVVTPFASMNKEIGVDLLGKTGLLLDQLKPTDTRYFKLEKEESSGKFKLVMDHQALFSFTDEQGIPIITKDPNSETTWCPARYGVGQQKNVIKEFSEWVVELAEKYVFPKLEADGKVRDAHDQEFADKIKKLFKGGN